MFLLMMSGPLAARCRGLSPLKARSCPIAPAGAKGRHYADDPNYSCAAGTVGITRRSMTERLRFRIRGVRHMRPGRLLEQQRHAGNQSRYRDGGEDASEREMAARQF